MPFTNPLVAGNTLIRTAIQSQNYLVANDGTITGWQIAADGSATFTNVAIGGLNYNIDSTGQASFDTVNVDTDINLGGVSLNETLDLVPDGIIAYADSTAYNVAGGQWTVNTAAVSASTMLFEFDIGPLRADRYYRITISYLCIQTVATDNFRQTFRYTVDGTAPSTASGIMDGSEANVGGSLRYRQIATVIYSPAIDYDIVRIGLTLARNTGTGTIQVETNDPNTQIQCMAEDLGDQNLAISGGALSQKSKTSGTVDPDPVSTYVKTYQANWSRTWNNSGADVNVTNGEIDQGNISGFGNRISWIGFPFATIQSDLSGATVKKVEVYLKYYHWYNNSGGTAVIGTHNSTATSAPSYDASKDNQNRKTVSGWSANSAKWVDITSVVGSEFKSGTSTGIVIGKGPSTNAVYYGKAYGNSQSGEPALRITYTK